MRSDVLRAAIESELEAHKDKLIQLRGKLQKAVDNLDVSGWIYSHHVGVCDIQIRYYNIYIYFIYITKKWVEVYWSIIWNRYCGSMILEIVILTYFDFRVPRLHLCQTWLLPQMRLNLISRIFCPEWISNEEIMATQGNLADLMWCGTCCVAWLLFFQKRWDRSVLSGWLACKTCCKSSIQIPSWYNMVQHIYQ